MNNQNSNHLRTALQTVKALLNSAPCTSLTKPNSFGSGFHLSCSDFLLRSVDDSCKASENRRRYRCHYYVRCKRCGYVYPCGASELFGAVSCCLPRLDGRASRHPSVVCRHRKPELSGPSKREAVGDTGGNLAAIIYRHRWTKTTRQKAKGNEYQKHGVK